MSNAVDNRVVQLEMQNSSFERNAKQSIRTLSSLDEALAFKNGDKGFENVEKAAAKCNFAPLLSAADSVIGKFSAIEVAGITALSNITNRAVNAGIAIAKSLSVDQISNGFSKYEQKTANVQTLINSTGKSIQEVNGYLDRLMWFSDETSYGFTDMTQALATMVSAGGDIDKIVPMIEGMANATAFAGKGAAEFNRVIYNLNQSYSQGFLSYMDWKSVQMAGANSKQLVETLIRAGEEAGTIKKGEVTIDNFTDTLSKKWATREVMEKGFGYFDEMTQKAYEMIGTLDDQGNTIETATQAYEILSRQYDTVSLNAAKAAQEAKSFTEAIDSTKDAVSSGWMRTFEIIFGDYEQAKTLWSGVADGLWDIFAGGFEERNNLLEDVFRSSPVEKFSQKVEEAGVSFDDFKSKMKEAYEADHANSAAFGDFDALTADATTFNDILSQSWVNSSLLERTLGKLPKAMKETSKGAGKAKGDIRALLKEVNSGKYGYGIQEQQKQLIAAGIDGSYLGTNWLQLMYNAAAHDNEELVNSMNSTIFGVEEVNNALEAQTDIWDELAAQAKDFDNNYYSANSGRTIMLDGLKNVLSAVGDRLGVVKDAWDRAFPKMTAERLRNMIISFHYLTTQLKMGEKEGKILGTVFDRMFGVLSKIVSVVGGVGRVGVSIGKLAVRFGEWVINLDAVQKALGAIKQFLDKLHGDTIGGLEQMIVNLKAFAEYLDALDNKDFDKLPGMFQKFATKMAPVVNLWRRLKAVATPVIKSIGSFLQNAGNWIYSNVLHPFGTFISEVINSEDPIGTLIAGIESFGKKALDAFKKLGTYIKNFKFTTFLSNLGDKFPGLEKAIDAVKDAFERLTTSADGAKKSLDFGKLATLATLLGMVGILAIVGKALDSVTKAADMVKSTFANVHKIFISKFGNTFAVNVRTVALAVTSLAASLYIISGIPSDKLLAASKALGALMVVLGVMAGLMTFISTKLAKSGKAMDGLVKPVLAMSVSILILSFALRNASKALDGVEGAKATWLKVGSILALIAGVGLEIIGFAALMSLLGGKITIAAVVMVLISTAILLVANSLGALKDLELSSSAQAAMKFIAVIALISTIASLIGKAHVAKNMISGFLSVALGIAALAGAVYLAMLAMDKLKTLKFSDIIAHLGELIVVLGIVAGLAVLVGVVGKKAGDISSSVAKIGIGVLAMIGAMYLITLLLERVAKIGDSDAIASAAMAMAIIGILVSLMAYALSKSAAISEGGKGALKISIGVLALTAALAVMVGLMKVIDLVFGQTTLKHIAKVGGILAGLVVLMAGLAAAIGYAGKLGGGKGVAVLVAAIAGIVILATILVLLTNFKWSELWPAIVAIGVTMLAFGAMIVMIGKAVQLATSTRGVDGSIGKSLKGVLGLVAVVGIIAALGAALYFLAKYDWTRFVAPVVAMGAVLAALCAAMAFLNGKKFEESKGLFGKVLTSVSLLIVVAGSLYALCQYSWQQFIAPVIAIGAVLGLLVGAMALMNKVKFKKDGLLNALTAMALLVTIALSLYVLSDVMATLADLQVDQVRDNMITLVAAVIIAAAGLVLLANAAKNWIVIAAIAVIAAALVAFGVAIGYFADAVMRLQGVDLLGFAGDIAVFAGSCLLLAIAALGMIVGSVGLLAISAAIAVFGLAAGASSGSVISFAAAIEYLASVISSIASAFQEGNNFIEGLANINDKLKQGAQDFNESSDQYSKGIAKILNAYSNPTESDAGKVAVDAYNNGTADGEAYGASYAEGWTSGANNGFASGNNVNFNPNLLTPAKREEYLKKGVNPDDLAGMPMQDAYAMLGGASGNKAAEQAGKNNANAYADGVQSAAPAVQNAVPTVATVANETNADAKQAGADNITAYAEGASGAAANSNMLQNIQSFFAGKGITLDANTLMNIGNFDASNFDMNSLMSVLPENAQKALSESGGLDISSFFTADPNAMSEKMQESMAQAANTDLSEQAGAVVDNMTSSMDTQLQSKSDTWTESLKTFFTNAGANIDWTGITNVLTGDFVTKFGESLINNGTGDFTPVEQSITMWLTNAIGNSDLSGIGGEAADKVAEAFATGVSSPANAQASEESGLELANSAKSGAEQADSSGSGNNFALGFINAIGAHSQEAYNAAFNLGKKACEGLSAGIDEGSPSKLTAISGKYFDQGFIIAIDANAMYAAAAAYKMGYGAVESLNEGIQNGDVARVVPVLDVSDLYNQMEAFDGVYRPRIAPTLDMSGVDPAWSNMRAVATVKSAQSPSVAYEQDSAAGGGYAAVNFTQNNYSPKSLSAVEIYRQTKNQLDTVKGLIKKA